MAIYWASAQISVTDEPVVLFNVALEELREYSGFIKNIGNECVYIGGTGVTEETGYELNGREELKIDKIIAGDTIVAICKSEESSNLCWFLSAYV